jgi:hypothetical protein
MIILELNPINNQAVIRLITTIKTKKDSVKLNKKINKLQKKYIEIPGSQYSDFCKGIFEISFLKKKESKCKKI